MVRVIVKQKYNEVEFEFKVSKVEEPAEEPQEESRFVEPTEDTF